MEVEGGLFAKRGRTSGRREKKQEGEGSEYGQKTKMLQRNTLFCVHANKVKEKGKSLHGL